MGIFITLGSQQAGSFSKEGNGINDETASRPRTGEAPP
jgi:hypothetical protein